MPKQRKQDGLDDLVELFALVPWWVPFGLAVVTLTAVPALIRAQSDSTNVEKLAGPICVLIAVVLTATGVFAQILKATRRRLLLRSRSIQALHELSWREFEDLCAEAYRRMGYAVSLTANGADGGVDLVLQKGSERIFVQCKRQSKPVSVRLIRELFGVIKAEGATGGIFITTSSFSADAKDFARGKVTLVDGDDLIAMLAPLQGEGDEGVPANRPRPATPGAQERATLLEPVRHEAAEEGSPLGGSPPTCRCGSAMALRRNRRTGAPFFGCTRFPKCRQTQAVP